MDFMTLGSSKKYTRKKIEEAGGWTDEGIAEVVNVKADEAIKNNKAISIIKQEIEDLKTFVTPEMFGAKGDGVTDDFKAIQNAVNTGFPVKLNNTYKITDIVRLNTSMELFGTGTIIIDGLKTLGFKFTNCDDCTIKVKDVTIENRSEKLENNKQFMLFLVEGCVCNVLELDNVTFNVTGSISSTVSHTRTIKNYIIKNSVFRNMADNDLGGIFWFNTNIDTNILIENCIFEQNCADEMIGLYGGQEGNEVVLKLTCRNCSFIKHSTTNIERGFLLSSYGDYNEAYTKFENCSFVLDGKIASLYCLEKRTHALFENCTITGTPFDCLFFSRTYKNDGSYDLILRNCDININGIVDGCSNVSSVLATNSSKPCSDICIENCKIKCTMVATIRADEADRKITNIKIENSLIDCSDTIFETLRQDTGIITIRASIIQSDNIGKYNTTNYKGASRYTQNKVSIEDNIEIARE